MKAPLILSIVAMMSLSTSCKGTINEQTLAPGTPETPVSVKTRIKVASFNIRYSNTSVDKGDNNWPICPFAVLTAIGNGRGGGDYDGIEMDMVGAWAWDEIAITKKIPEGFKLLDFHFEEQYR